MKYVLLCLVMTSVIFAYNYHGCALAPDNLHGWVICLDTVLILHTTDGGETWQPQNPPDTDPRFIFDVTCIDSLHAWTIGYHYLLAGEILGTENGGIDWVRQHAMFAKYGTRIEFIDENYGWGACGDAVVCMTTNGGDIWASEFINEPWAAGAEFYGVSFVNQMDGWLVAGWPDTLANGQGLITRSTDGGLTWDSLYQVTGYEDLLDVYFFNLLDGIVVGGDDETYEPIILKTTDGGLSWDPITAPDSAYYLRAIDFADNEGWAVGKHGTVIHTTDYGNTWEFMPNPAESTLFDVDFTDNLHGIACGYDIILTTTNGGQNWGIHEDKNESNTQIIKLDFYPNPFHDKINIKFSIERNAHGEGRMALNIYDVTGRLIRQFDNMTIGLSDHVVWNGTDEYGHRVPEGIYFVYLETDNYQETSKITLIK